MATTIWTPTNPPNTGTNLATYSLRNWSKTLSGATQGQVRVNLTNASGAGTLTFDHVAIGISSATNGGATKADTTLTPVELLFTGASGVTITVGNTAQSDWVNFPITSSDLIVILDFNATNGNAMYSGAGSANSQMIFKAGGATYNNTDGTTGFTDNGAFVTNITSIETQATAAVATLMGAICL